MNITSGKIKSVNFNNKVLWFVVMLFFGVITGIAIADNKWIYLGIVLSPVIIYLCINKPFIFPFGLYAFLIPFDGISAVAESGTTLTKLLGVLSILVLSVKGALENKLIKPDFASIWWILFLMYGALTVFWAIKPEVVISQTLIGLAVLYLVTSSYKIQKSEFDTIKWCIIIGGAIAALYAVYNYESTLTVESSRQRGTLDVGDREANAAYFAYSLILPVLICIQMIIERKKTVMRIIIGVVTVVMVFCIMISGARGAMLGIAAGIITYIFCLKNKITYVTISIAIGIVLIPFIPDLFFDRWGVAIEEGGSGRTSIWYVGLMCAKKYWLIGAGSANFPLAYEEFASYAPHWKGYNRAPHNLYIGTLVELGIIGFSLLIMVIIKHYQAIRSSFSSDKSNQIMLIASILGLLVSCFFVDLVYKKSFWLVWMIIMMYRNTTKIEVHAPGHHIKNTS